MSNVLRMAVLVGAGLGATWAAGQLSGQLTGATRPVWTPASELRAALQDEDPAATVPAAGADTESPPADAPPAAVVPELTQEEIEEALAAAERTLRGGPAPGEAVADRPLPADLAVALPSDI